jgi:hypothetical protein
MSSIVVSRPLALQEVGHSFMFQLLFLPLVSLSLGSPKNVLFLVVGDLRSNTGAYNFSIAIAETPNLDQLARSGLLFTRAQCPLLLRALGFLERLLGKAWNNRVVRAVWPPSGSSGHSTPLKAQSAARGSPPPRPTSAARTGFGFRTHRHSAGAAGQGGGGGSTDF